MQRVHEMCVRIALGARQGDILRLGRMTGPRLLPDDLAEANRVFDVAAGRAALVFTWLFGPGRAGKVYIARGGGHIWNFVCDYHGHVCLVDVSTCLFRQLKRAADARAPYWWSPVAKMPFNYCDPSNLDSPDERKKLTISFSGALHSNWQELLDRPRAARLWTRVREAPK